MLIPRSSFLTSKLWRSDILILGTNHTPLLFWLKAALPGADHIISLIVPVKKRLLHHVFSHYTVSRSSNYRGRPNSAGGEVW